MSRFFPHTPYAEDQPFYHTVLTTHVLYRGFQVGAIGGIMTGVVRSVVKSIRTGSSSTGFVGWSALQRSTGIGSMVGLGALVMVLPLRMWGKEEIEWKDRTWRLLENKGQMAVDDWSLSGAVLMPLYMSMRKQSGERLGWKMAMGRAGIGSTAGIIGYLSWTYLINRGSL
ncbi:uncharacterized protein V1513DRAFT_455626 [Lipomyces chichibuensis]|uniref:uncharacterized protein n=1 Tax=Lipomyces chichibuensis TaxID=1546026 RepID=UPI00334396FF